MPLITETYYLSLTQDNRGILRLRCSQDDTLRTVNLKLYNNGSIFVIPSGVSASISGVRQNGTVFSKPCTISQDRQSVVLQLSSDITNVDGIIVAEIVLNDGEGGRLGTSNFIIQVEKNPIRAGVVQDTETPIEYINDFIEKIQTLTARLNNLIAPSGDPSLAEVVDARIGILDSTTYQTLGARLNAEFQRLSNALNGITILESTGDTTDRTSEILSKLNVYGTCKLGKGDFYVKNLVMPEDSMLVGSGNSTRIVLLGSETNTYIVKPRSNCIVENISFDGGFTGTYSELIANSDARRHCIILDKFNDVNSENVILSNIVINNFVGSAIVQRYTTGCRCKDVVINMCYAGIDISNASYDGQCANTSISNTKFGVIQNGSNFVFNNCISKDSVQHIMSDQQNTECTFSSCTFFDSSLETTSRLAILSNARNGFVFDNCIFDSSLSMLLVACDGIVIKGTNFVGSDTFAITVSNSRNTLLLITDCIADVEPTVTNAGTAARITSCYLKDGTAWTISEADITVDDELSDESENPVQNKVINRAVSELKADLDAIEPGLSDAAKAALLNCFNHVSWKNGVGMEYFNELEEALGSAVRIDTSELKQGGFSNTYPYFVSSANRLVYVGTKIETTPGCQYRIEFKNNTTDSIDVGVYAFNGSTLEKVQNQETISVAGGDNQGWQLSNYTFIAGNDQKLVWITFRKNAGDVPIIASDISDVKISRIGKPGIMAVSYQEILVSSQYHANHTSSRTIGAGVSAYRHIDGEINYQNCPVNKIKLKALATGTITLGKIKKSDAAEGNPGDMSLAHRKVTVQITQTGEQEVEFEGFPVADDEYVCLGFNSWDDSDKTKTTAKWTYGQQSTDKGYMYMQNAEPHKWVFWTGGTGNGINLYIRKRVYS